MLPVISDPESLTAPAGGTAAGDASTDDGPTPADVLADRHRQRVVRYLETQTDPVAVSELADHLAIEQHDQPAGPIANWGDALLGTRRRLRLSLRHSHLPKLEEAGVVCYERDENTVSLREDHAASRPPPA